MKDEINAAHSNPTENGHTSKNNKRLPQSPFKRVLYLSLQAVVNAFIIGFIARGLVYLISLITNISFHGKFSFEETSPAGGHLGMWIMVVPVIGGLIVGIIAKYGSAAIRGHGIPEAMEKIILGDSKIPPSITFLKPVSSAIAIGTGGPFGAEGPIIATGGALGSWVGQWIHISSSERKILLTAGACAGMAAIFGTPLAAVLLAIELLLFEFSPRSIIPVSLACIVGLAMHKLLFGNMYVFKMPDIPAASNIALCVYVLIGGMIGVIASLITKSVYAVEDLFEKLPIHWMWWPAIGAVAIGVIGYFYPDTMGVGYYNITNLLGGILPLMAVLTLCLFKYLSWVIALGSGTSGGTLAPLFTIGGGFGSLLGFGILHFFPNSGINIQTAALIGMAAMFSGASRAVLTSIVFALETTGQLNGLSPLIGGCVAAYFVSFFLMKNTIMTEKIVRRGVITPNAYEPDILQSITAGHLVIKGEKINLQFPVVHTGDDIAWVADLMSKYMTNELTVVDNEDNPVGIITANAILNYYSQQRHKDTSYESPLRTRRLLVRGRKIIH